MKQIDDINTEINNLRKIIYFIESELFKKLYSEASTSNKYYVDVFIESRDLLSIKRWIDEQRSYNLNTMSLLMLRQTARGVGIVKVEQFNKDQLIGLIMDRRKKANK